MRLTESAVDKQVLRDAGVVYIDPGERLCYRPEEAGRVVRPWGQWIIVVRNVPTNPAPVPGCGYWARPWYDEYDSRGRYSVRINLPDGSVVRLWPYEYVVLPQEEIDRALARGELAFHPFGSEFVFRETPELADMIGALRLDGLSIHQAVYELQMAGVEDAADVHIPPPGWLEATFRLPWC